MTNNFKNGFESAMRKLAADMVVLPGGLPLKPEDTSPSSLDRPTGPLGGGVRLAPGAEEDKLKSGFYDLSSTEPVTFRLSDPAMIDHILPPNASGPLATSRYVTLPGGLASITNGFNKATVDISYPEQGEKVEDQELISYPPPFKPTKLKRAPVMSEEEVRQNTYGGLLHPTRYLMGQDVREANNRAIEMNRGLAKREAAINKKLYAEWLQKAEKIKHDNELIEAANAKQRELFPEGFKPSRIVKKTVEAPFWTSTAGNGSKEIAGIAATPLLRQILAEQEQSQKLRAGSEADKSFAAKAKAEQLAKEQDEADLQRLREEEKARQIIEQYKKLQETAGRPQAPASGTAAPLSSISPQGYLLLRGIDGVDTGSRNKKRKLTPEELRLLIGLGEESTRP